MSRASLVLASVFLFVSCALTPSTGFPVEKKARALSAEKGVTLIFPHNIDCRDFDRTADKVWHLRHRAVLDLGNWDGAFEISGPISPGLFVNKGIDLFSLLQTNCAQSA